MPSGGQKGSANAFKYGAYALLAIRTKGKPNGNTKLGRAFRARELEYMQDMGGEENLSLAQRQVANDNTWCDLLIATMDNELATKKRLTRKGKPHPLIDLRIRIAAHRRENYKLAGLKRVLPPPKTLADYMAEIQEDQPDQQPGTVTGTASDIDPRQGSLPRKTGDTGDSGNGSEDSSSEMAQITAVKESPDTGDEPVMSDDDTGKDNSQWVTPISRGTTTAAMIPL
jgi:hypothetical protein